MTDKQRAEFVEKWALVLNVPSRHGPGANLLGMLLEYDKLNDDRWARLKEFVEAQIAHCELNRIISGLDRDTPFWETYRIILAEIERLEEGK